MSLHQLVQIHKQRFLVLKHLLDMQYLNSVIPLNQWVLFAIEWFWKVMVLKLNMLN